MQKDHYFRSTLDGKDVFEYIPQAYAKKYNAGKVLKMNSAEQGINKSKFKYSEGLYKTIPGSEVYKFYTFMDEYNPKLYNFLKKLNQAKAYTYYYLGNEFANEVVVKQKK